MSEWTQSNQLYSPRDNYALVFPVWPASAENLVKVTLSQTINIEGVDSTEADLVYQGI